MLSVSYDDLAPWPVTPDDFGFSLVPVQPNANPDPDNPANWRASTLSGGSPGADDPAASVPPVLINEVLSHSETGVDFIELFNPNRTNAVDIGGWFLTDDPGTPMKYRIVGGTFIAPLGSLVFTEAQFNPTPGVGNSFSLNARGDDVYLFSGDANTNLTGYSHGFTFRRCARWRRFRTLRHQHRRRAFPRSTLRHARRSKRRPAHRPDRHQRNHVPSRHRR